VDATSGAQGFEFVPHGSAARRQEGPVGWLVAGAFGLACALIAPALLFFLLAQGLSFLASDAAATLLDTHWYPAEGVYGLVPLVAGSVLVSLGGLALAVPLGIGTAITLRFYASGRLLSSAEALVGVLGGIPSVVFGLFGTFWLIPHFGASLATAALVLAAMLTPTLTLLSLAGLRQLPEGLLLDGGRLGLSREQVITRLALRAARPALCGAAVLALARALGEALAVEMVCGNVPGLPASLTDPVRTLTTTLVQEFEYAQRSHSQALHLVALAVVLIAALSAAAALRLSERRRA
jgi:phosphate transport system permease protein